MSNTSAEKNKDGGPILPEPRRPNGIRSAEDGIRAVAERFELAATWAGVAVVAAVIFEVPLILWPPEAEGVLQLLEAAATFVIGVGVAGEILFANMASSRQRELLRISDKYLMEALFTAAEAQYELAKLKAPRALTAAQRDAVEAAVKPFAGQQYALSVATGDEPHELVAAIDSLLKSAGWTPHPPFGGVSVNAKCGKVGMNTLSDVHVRVAPDHTHAVDAAAVALLKALIANGIPSVGANDPVNIPDKAVINIMVGIKAQ